MTVIGLSAFVAHAGWHSMLERGAQLAKFLLPATVSVAAPLGLVRA